MENAWDNELMWAKYHNTVTQRIFGNFSNYEDKNFIIATISESAKTTSYFINACLIYLSIKHNTSIPRNPTERLNLFSEKAILLGYSPEIIKNLLLIIKIKITQKKSPIQFLKQDKILLLDEGKYRILTLKKLKELISTLNKAIIAFPKN